jgi:hypothetical protein
MSATRHLTIALAGASVALAGLAIAPAASAAPSTGVVDCAGKVQVKPKQIVLSCADDNLAVTKVKWTKWDLNSAKGTGTLVWNTCLPKTCVDGIVQKYKVIVTLGRVASGPNVSVFSGMTLKFPGNAPAGAETATYTIDNPIT